VPIQEINTLLAASWPRLSDGWVRELRDGLRAWRLDTGQEQGRRYRLTLRLENVQVQWRSFTFDDPRYPPGYTTFSPQLLQLGLPAHPDGWVLDISARLRGRVTGLPVPITINEQQSIQVRGLRALVGIRLADGNTDRPRLVGLPDLDLGFQLFFNGLLTFETDRLRRCPLVEPGDVYCFELDIDKGVNPARPGYRFQGKVSLRIGEKIFLVVRGSLFGDDGGPAFDINESQTLPIPAALRDVFEGAPRRRETLPRRWGEGVARPITPAPPNFGFGS
jgi:hypothetical protein